MRPAAHRGDQPHPAPGHGAPDPDDLAILAFTSGSTGPPKAVRYTQRQLAHQATLAGEVLGIGPGTVVVAGFVPFALYGPALGATVVVPDMDFRKPAAVDPVRLVAAIHETGASVLFGSPALLAPVARYCTDHRLVLDSLTCVASFGAPLPAATADLLLRCLPADTRIRSVYGATECLPVSVLEREDLADTRQAREQGAGMCLGTPLPQVSVRIIPADAGPVRTWSPDLLLPAGRVGEITVSGANVSRAYFGRPDADGTTKILDNGAVLHRTGDLGRLDERGRLWLAGRKVQRVRTVAGPLDTECVEPVCDTAPGVLRTALVDADGPVLCVELGRKVTGADRVAALHAVRERLDGIPTGRQVGDVLVHPGFPVDIRHNAKIDRERLARWARGQRRGTGHGRSR